jgi:hypothetical protein
MWVFDKEKKGKMKEKRVGEAFGWKITKLASILENGRIHSVHCQYPLTAAPHFCKLLSHSGSVGGIGIQMGD